jgi:hypothetical protein
MPTLGAVQQLKLDWMADFLSDRLTAHAVIGSGNLYTTAIPRWCCTQLKVVYKGRETMNTTQNKTQQTKNNKKHHTRKQTQHNKHTTTNTNTKHIKQNQYTYTPTLVVYPTLAGCRWCVDSTYQVNSCAIVVLPNRGGEDTGRTPKKTEKMEVEEDEADEDSDASEDQTLKTEDETGEQQKPDDIDLDATTRKMQHTVEAKLSEHARGLKVKD